MGGEGGTDGILVSLLRVMATSGVGSGREVRQVGFVSGDMSCRPVLLVVALTRPPLTHPPPQPPTSPTRPFHRPGPSRLARFVRASGPEEENYTSCIIQDFNKGYLPIVAGTTLRSFLSEKVRAELGCVCCRSRPIDRRSLACARMRAFLSQSHNPTVRSISRLLHLSPNRPLPFLQLNCDPMRITKKFVGASCIGKQVFQPCDPLPENEVVIGSDLFVFD